MYLDFEESRKPLDDMTIWRYVDFTKFLSMLESKALHFCRADLLGDKYEGAYPEKSYEVQFPGLKPGEPYPEWWAEMKKTHKTTAKRLRRTMFLNCWHMNRHQSAAMWKLYLQSNEGVAIRSTFGRLKESLHIASEIVYAGAVSYLDYQTEAITLGNAFSPFLHKRKSFAHEMELRAFYFHPANVREVLLGEKEPAAGYNIHTDLDKLVESVYVAPTSAGWFRGLTEAVLKRYGLQKEVEQSDLESDPVW